MFFKNLRIYRVHEALTLNPKKLAEYPARECGAYEAETLGFWPPLGRGSEQLVFVGAGGRFMLCARKYEKVLPAPAVNEEVDKKVYEIEHREERTVRRKERQTIKEEVIQRMLPNAPQKPKDTYLYYDPHAALIVVDTSSEKLAADVLAKLRDALGSLRVTTLRLNHSPAHTMTGWVRAGLCRKPFELGEDAVLEEPTETGAKGAFSHHNLAAETIAAHLETGMLVTKLALGYDERLTCMVDEELTVTKLRFEDVTLTELENTEVETDAERFDAEFALMAGELERFTRDLIAAFGGEQSDEDREAA